MTKTYNIMIMGASYGSLLGTKLAMAGHNCTLVCLPEEADLINKEGQTVRMPIRGRDDLVVIDSNKLPGKLRGATTKEANPADYDLIGLAMQEPQYGSPGVRELLDAVGKSGKPCMSIMNMPPLPYLARIPGLDMKALRDCYTAPEVWDNVLPKNITLASPDPQAFRPPEEKTNVLQVSLPTNFKVARFESNEATAMLKQLQKDIEDVRFDPGDGKKIELPVKLKVHDSVFVPLAKWAMLITGNYRCIQKEDMRPIRDAVHSSPQVSAHIYNWVKDICVSVGANAKDMVPFEKYAAAAQGLAKPSSAARALFGGAKNIERVDKVVYTIARAKGKGLSTLDETVGMVNARLEKNRKA